MHFYRPQRQHLGGSPWSMFRLYVFPHHSNFGLLSHTNLINTQLVSQVTLKDFTNARVHQIQNDQNLHHLHPLSKQKENHCSHLPKGKYFFLTVQQ